MKNYMNILIILKHKIMAQTAMTVPSIIAADNDENIREKAIKAFRNIRREAMSRPEPEMTLEEINAEINAVRETKQET